jgi:hypothetical protein
MLFMFGIKDDATALPPKDEGKLASVHGKQKVFHTICFVECKEFAGAKYGARAV